MFHLVWDQLQGLKVLELSVSPDTFLSGGEPDRECSHSPDVLGVTAGRESEELCPEREMI